MDNIPHNIRIQMMIDSILLLKQQNGWDTIHYTIKNRSLYLKKTTKTKISCDIVYETILRANTLIYFVNGKTYTWLKKMKELPKHLKTYDEVYYYLPRYMQDINIS